MTGYDAVKRAMNLLGYSAEEGERYETNSASVNGLGIIKQISSDLGCGIISSLSASLEISPEKEEALCYGTAMLLALREGDAEKNRLFAEIYNQKRGTALAGLTHIKDCLPKVTVG